MGARRRDENKEFISHKKNRKLVAKKQAQKVNKAHISGKLSL